MSSIPPAYPFPADFVWGAATSSYQIEGAVNADGRKPSIWDTFSHTPGKTHGGDTGDRACEHYTRYKDDVALMKELGLKAYRFSLSWSRIFPDGGGQLNPRGLDFYSRLVEELLENDIQPYVTLFHWDLPQALEDEIGGWRSRQIANYFADYATAVGSALGDRVKNFFTINEFLCFTDLGYRDGSFAPGLRCDARTVNEVRHNAMLAHGRGVQALRESCPSDCRIGLAENIFTTVPFTETEANIAAAKQAYLDEYAFYIRVIMEGRYQESHMDSADAPTVLDGDLEIISSPVDLVGINSYSPVRIRAADTLSGWESIPEQDGTPASNSPWFAVGPEVVYWGPRWLHELWGVEEIVISENGTYGIESLDEADSVRDHHRVDFLRQHLKAASRCVAEGYPLKGYFQWSLLDNFEWAEGYEKRFGLYFVDYATQQRLPKLSAQFYQDVIRENRVV